MKRATAMNSVRVMVADLACQAQQLRKPVACYAQPTLAGVGLGSMLGQMKVNCAR